MSASMQLTTLESLKRYLGLAGDDVTHDALLEDLIAAASARIESHCERRFGAAEVTEFADGSGTAELALSRRPVQSVASVRVDAEREFPPSSALPEGEIAIYPESGVIVRANGRFPRGRRNVRADYTGGYDAPPADLALAAVKLAAAWFAHARSGADGIERESLGDYSAEYSARALPPDVEAALAYYRDIRPA